jgi:hypothetical protein
MALSADGVRRFRDLHPAGRLNRRHRRDRQSGRLALPGFQKP